jgi:hypothetical protein
MAAIDPRQTSGREVTGYLTRFWRLLTCLKKQLAGNRFNQINEGKTRVTFM